MVLDPVLLPHYSMLPSEANEARPERGIAKLKGRTVSQARWRRPEMKVELWRWTKLGNTEEVMVLRKWHMRLLSRSCWRENHGLTPSSLRSCNM